MQTYSQSKIQSWLVWFLRGVLIFGFLFLFAKLIDLQIIKGRYFNMLAQGNRLRRIPVEAPRGSILARGGQILVGNEIVKKRILFSKNGDYEKTENLEGSKENEIFNEWRRIYYSARLTAHITGYLGEVSDQEVDKVSAQCLDKGHKDLGDHVGRTGIEESYDCTLRGIDGEMLVEVDALDRVVRQLGFKKPITGENLTTTIDYGLQETVSKLMDGKNGAVIVSDARGEILALFSTPSFDPNMFLNKQRQAELKNSLEDKTLPFFNRAIGGIYPPGSLFKPIVAIAALQEGKIDKNYSYDDTGFIAIKTPYGDFTYKNWYFTQYGGSEGRINLVKALARSTDTFFYKLGEITQIENIEKWAKNFNLDLKTGIDIPGEAGGLVPSPEWKMRIKGEKWFLGNTYHLSIGQGDIALSPLGVNAAITGIANGGEYCTPHLSNNNSENKCRSLGIKKENIELVKEGMRQACSTGGTGYPFFDFEEKTGFSVACKTGTAENPGKDPHAWFTAFAPIENPEVITTVLIENGGEGSKVAGPIAREIFNYWLKERPRQ